MLDPAMQQFADEMLAQPRPPRRASTKRNAEIDQSSPTRPTAKKPRLTILQPGAHASRPKRWQRGS